ncbi:HSF-type DNA-binding-domain-containing protein [Trametes elegans]|nr:HSF-type DNA-binding-domain-containing protein [Trametes elegans]
MSSQDAPYSQQQPQSQQSQQWSQQSPSHLLPPPQPQSSFPSPSSPASSLSEQPYQSYFHQHSAPHSGQSSISDSLADRPGDKTALSLNLSSLTVTSPTNLSPINPSPHPSTHASSHVSPITPISPSGGLLGHHHPQHHPHIQQPFQFAAPDQGVRYDDAHYDSYGGPKRLTSSRSSSSSEKSVPRKRSYTTLAPLTTSVEETAYDMGDAPPGSAMYDDVDIGYGAMDTEGSPIDGSNSGGEQDEHLKPMEGQVPTGAGSTLHAGAPPPSLGVLNKPLGTNNFVTKLYQMINDPKSSQFINWTEHGTSFVVSNVGEFSRTILGSHFKHNNFSSFVRQLNMYGFHKINRTPRAQRTSADVQTWEFSHHKFLRGRPDLLEEIKRKALEPDPSLKHRVELPGEVAAQLSQMREDNRRLMIAFQQERGKVERLAGVTKVMYDIMSKSFPSVPVPFPTDILDTGDSPNIYVTSPTSSAQAASHYPSLSSLPNSGLHSLHTLSPSSSPTTADFPSHTHTPHTLSRQHSYQHIPSYDGMHHAHSHHAHHAHQHAHHHHGMHGVSPARYETALTTPLPPSPGPMDFDDRIGAKRQRTGPGSSTSFSVPGSADGSGASTTMKKGSRARSDSAPLGYGLTNWPQTRPRSGSGLAPRAVGSSPGGSNLAVGSMTNGGRREEVPNIGSLSRGQLPMLSIPSMTKQPSS